MIAAAFILAVASVAVVTTLQQRADSARDAQVTLAQVQRGFDVLQSIPYDTIGASAGERDAVVQRMQAGELLVGRRLVELRQSAPSRHLDRAIAAYPANFATLEQIRSLLVRGRQHRSDELGPVAGRQQRAVNGELDRAGIEYRQRAARSLRWGMLGSAAAILALVSLFGVFYTSSRSAHAKSERLAHENARLQLQESQLQVIHRLARAAEYRDDQTGRHTRRVGDLSADIGSALGMPVEQLDLLREAAPLHDVGKIGIPDSILLKPGRLTPVEFEEMKSHTTLGARILAGGRGLPLLEMAEEIAPTHARPYKDAWSMPDAVSEITAQAGRQFDPVIVEAFLSRLPALTWGHDEDDPGVTDTLAVAQAMSSSTRVIARAVASP